MTYTATRPDARPGAWIHSALPELEAARDQLFAAKRTRSPELIELAERRMQKAVDVARDQDVEWGEIGAMLGIARGNAYKRYRRRPSPSGFTRLN